MQEDPGSGHLKLLVTSGVARIDPRKLAQFREAGFELAFRYDLSGRRDDDLLIEALDGVWGVLAGTEFYTRRVFAESPGLRVISRCGVGYDAIDIDAADEYEKMIVTTPGTNDESVGEFALALALALLDKVCPGRSLSGETVTIVGLGAIGLGVARRLTGFGCRVIGVDPFADTDACKELGIELSGLRDALVRAGIVFLHAPLNSRTKGMIGAPELELIPPDGLLINTARGGIVDEDALLRALANRRICGAGIDVFAEEPLPHDHPMRNSPATVMAGHIAGMTHASVAGMLNQALASLIDIRDGRVPDQGVVNTRLLTPRHYGSESQPVGGSR